jgi:hypothetical protein
MGRRTSRCQVSGNAPPNAGGVSRSEREQYCQAIIVQAIDPEPLADPAFGSSLKSKRAGTPGCTSANTWGGDLTG